MTAVMPAQVGSTNGCPHTPPCPVADAPDHDAAKVIADHHDQGWVLLCGGVILFDDTGELVPHGDAPVEVVAPHRPEPPHHAEED